MRTTPTPAPDIAALFGRADVIAFELGGAGDEAQLHPDEAARIAHASDRRRQEFAAGRMCVRAALAELGVRGDRPLGSAEDRSPLWPDGVIGSISHTSTYCVAIVAVAGVADSGIGIDAEQLGRVTDNLHRTVFTADERSWLDRLSTEARSDAATTLFSAKEAFYKAQHPITRSWVGFKDVSAERSAAGLVLHPATDLDALGRLIWPQSVAAVRRDDIVVTAVEVRTS
jgi:4'-phosphopantetheinyl transferase EntD